MNESPRVPSGVPELDEVLHGGYLPGRTVMVRGGPGLGKTILGLHFLAAARHRQEKALFISFSGAESTARSYAMSLGLDISTVQFLDLTPGAEFFASDAAYEIFSPSEVERGPTTRSIVDAITRGRPSRVFIDGASQLRYLHPNAYLYRKQLAAFMRFLSDMGCTALFTSEEEPRDPDHALAFLADGVINLVRTEGAWKLSVDKLRGTDFSMGWHPYRINNRGIALYPLLEPSRLSRPYRPRWLSTGFEGLDQRLGGGWHQGSSVLLQGQAGCGKSLLAAALTERWVPRGVRCSCCWATTSPPTATAAKRWVCCAKTAARFGWRRSLVVATLNCATVCVWVLMHTGRVWWWSTGCGQTPRAKLGPPCAPMRRPMALCCWVSAGPWRHHTLMQTRGWS